jgi:hypothetical protein
LEYELLSPNQKEELYQWLQSSAGKKYSADERKKCKTAPSANDKPTKDNRAE